MTAQIPRQERHGLPGWSLWPFFIALGATFICAMVTNHATPFLVVSVVFLAYILAIGPIFLLGITPRTVEFWRFLVPIWIAAFVAPWPLFMGKWPWGFFFWLGIFVPCVAVPFAAPDAQSDLVDEEANDCMEC